MLNKIARTVILGLITFTAQADTVAINSDHPEQYTVKKGDTLWDISGMFLRQPWRWPEVWKGNPQIADPHLIYPGDVISLTYVDGKPMLVASAPGMIVNGRNVKLSPVVREHERKEAIPTIPVDVIQSFLSRPLVVNEDEMDDWPYIVASYDEHLIASDGNKIYVRGLDDNAASQRYSVYRKGEAYISPEKNGEKDVVMGYEALYVGEAVIEDTGDPATGYIVNSNREIITGDRLIQEDEVINSEFIPRPPAVDAQGNIISVVDGVNQIGQYQVVVLDIGADDGIETGNVLGIYQKGAVVNDKIASGIKRDKQVEDILKRREENGYDDGLGGALEDFFDSLIVTKHQFDEKFPVFANVKDKKEEIQLPDNNAGVLMVIRTFDNISYGLVMNTTSPVHINDRVKRM